MLTAHRQVEALVALCVRHRPDLAVIADPALEAELARRLAAAGVRCEVASGHDALTAAAAGPLCDTVVAAIVGAAGLDSTLAAARAGKRLLLANKESIVMAGAAAAGGACADGGGALIPVDSEHNAIFQCLPGGRPDLARQRRAPTDPHRLGRPVPRPHAAPNWPRITPEQACKHPNWVMGRKISVDSATLMNKGLEVIEAHHLFGAPAEAIEVVVHPQSLVHSMVEYVDGSVLAQLGNPDMRTAIAHALAWPERVEAGVAPLDLAALRAAAVRAAGPGHLPLPGAGLPGAACRRRRHRRAECRQRGGGGGVPGRRPALPGHRRRGRERACGTAGASRGRCPDPG